MSLDAVRVSVQPPIRMIPDPSQHGLPPTAPVQLTDLTMCGTDHVATLASRVIWDRTGEDLAMPRIEDYALLGDLHTAALVSVAGSIDWLCLPRFDSPAMFAALLHDHEAGHWRLAPAGAGTCTARRYAGNTLVLETDWVTAGGAVRVIDFMPPRSGPSHVVRIAVGLSGEVAMQSMVRLRFDYGLVIPWVRHHDRLVDAIAGPDRVRLASTVPLRGYDRETLADFTVRQGDRVSFAMSWAPSHEPQMPLVDAEQALSATTDFWSEWSDQAAYQTGPYDAAVDRSLTTLKALTYEPTGGIVAAATTSLPEEIGAARNWDYRYCWLRDATYTLQALLAAGYRREAGAWRDWLLRAIAGQPDMLQTLYSLDGARRLPEAELPWLSGYEGSRPVRIGNAASGQLQIDVWGETLDALFLARQAGLPADRDAWTLQVALMNYLESAWREPDNGLWEVRGDRQHFTHSKVMAWVAADRMARSVRGHGLPGPALRWERLRDQIHRDVMAHAFDAERNTFTQAYGAAALDASLLLIPRVGFLPATDPRVLGTITAIRRELSDGGLVRRYSTSETDDGLKGGEGLFIACSFWLVDALYAAGQQRDATDLFGRLLLLRNDVGLLSEEWDPAARRQLGNFPQAFSHFALIISALQLHSGRAARSDSMTM
jgi:GH15 family glucan-1,4-alpha-glucosidase